MCQNCANLAAAAKTNTSEGVNGAPAVTGLPSIGIIVTQAPKGHTSNQDTVVFEAQDRVSIKPIVTLDDAVVTGHKIAKIAYPETFGENPQYAKYEADLVRAAAAITLLPDDAKFEGLVDLIGIALMGIEPQDLDVAKEQITANLEKAALSAVRQNTTNFLKDKGFLEV